MLKKKKKPWENRRQLFSVSGFNSLDFFISCSQPPSLLKQFLSMPQANVISVVASLQNPICYDVLCMRV